MSRLSINLSSSLKNHPRVNQLAAFIENPPDGGEGLKITFGKHQSPLITRSISRAVAIASLITIWTTAIEYGSDGVFENAELNYLDMLADYPGFGKAMVAAGLAHYDKKAKRITLFGLNETAQEGAVKKSPGALRQQRYRRSLKIKSLIIKGITAVLGEPGKDGTYKYDSSSVRTCVKKNEDGEVVSCGTVEMGGKTMIVSCLSSQQNSRCSPSRKQNVTLDHSGVTQGVTDTVTLSDSGVTQGVTDRVTLSDSGVIQGVTETVTPGNSGITRGVTDTVTLSDLGVTQGVTDTVTLDGSGVTDRFTPGIRENAGSGFPSRVIPSRAHTRFCFLRSKYINKILNKTHTAREVIHSPAEFFKPKITTGSSTPLATQTHQSTDKPLAEILHCPTSSRFNALFNVTQSVTLWRKGSEAICVSRDTPPSGSRRGQCQSQTAGKFAMAAGWQPSGEFVNIARQCGHELSDEPSPAEIAEFITYWSEEGVEHTQRQWENKLARCIAKGRKRLPRQKGKRQDFTVVSSMDYAIPEGFWGG